MSDEIKEILKKIKSVSNFDDYVDFVGTEFKPLLDYITNLQEENEKLKNEPLTNKMSRIDSVVAEIYRRNKEQEDYKSRNEKAIEYITSEETINMFISINAREKWIKINHKLLNILKGDKDE